MSEEEIINRIKEAIENDKKNRIVTIYDKKPLFRDVLQGLLDLYNKEKEKNKVYTELLKQNENRAKILNFIDNYLPDDEICECCSNYDVNGVYLKAELKKLLKAENTKLKEELDKYFY